MIPKIEIRQDGILTKVFMNGQQLYGIRGIHFDRTVDNDVPILKLDIIAADMTLDCRVIPKLPDIYEPFYEEKKLVESDEKKGE